MRASKIAFLNRRHDVENPEKNWSVSSPQHIDGQSLSEIFFRKLLSQFFGICRHPIGRFVSAFKHQKSLKYISLGSFN